MAEKVVITGIGVLSPIGTGRDAYWNALREGASGFRRITLFDPSPYPLKIAGEISSFDPLQFLDKKGLRTLDRSTRLVCSAAKLALDDAGLEINDGNSDSIGVSIGSTFGSLHSVSQFDREGLTEGPKYVNPSLFPNTVINSPASNIAIRFGMKGFNTTISTGFCASLDAIIYASDFITLGRAQAVLAGGVEELCEETFMMFNALDYLAKTGGGAVVCRPYGKLRNGFILSEGAAVLVLESEAEASKRGADVMVSIAGYGNAFGYSSGISSDNGAGLSSAIYNALTHASYTAQDIDCICGCANSTWDLDSMEARVLSDIFGDRVPVSAVKSMIGESYSASGALALCAAVEILRNKCVFPIANYSADGTGYGLDFVNGEERIVDVRSALVLASDPSGNSSALILERR